MALSSTILDEIIHRTVREPLGESGTITKCLRLRHFERFPQVDVKRLKWHFIHPLTKFGAGASSSESVVGARAVGPGMAATKWYL